MSTLLVATIAFTGSQVLLALLLICLQRQRGRTENLFALLLLAVLGYLLAPVAAGTPLAALTSVLQTAVPGMFWLFSASLFSDRFQLRRWHWGLLAATVLPPTLSTLLGDPATLDGLLRTLPQGLEFVLLGLALWVVAQHWRTDLVESRRRLRVWFVGLTGSYTLLLIFSREILFAGQAWFGDWQYLPLAVIWLAINALLLQYRDNGLFMPGGEAQAIPKIASARALVAADPDPALVRTLQAHMQTQQAWREMGLTIGQLAGQLEVPQYRLRLAINGGLGFRNFNDFLNSYRIAEAASRLATAASGDVSILGIALDVGFRSLSSFNKAFKDGHGVTPTAFRKAARQ